LFYQTNSGGINENKLDHRNLISKLSSNILEIDGLVAQHKLVERLLKDVNELAFSHLLFLSIAMIE
jgi:hypothetical protein